MLPPELLLHQNSSSGSVVSSIIIGAFISKLSFSFISSLMVKNKAGSTGSSVRGSKGGSVGVKLLYEPSCSVCRSGDLLICHHFKFFFPFFPCYLLSLQLLTIYLCFHSAYIIVQFVCFFVSDDDELTLPCPPIAQVKIII